MKNVFLFTIVASIVGVFYFSLPNESDERIFDIKSTPSIDLVDPEEAPSEIKDEVMQGYRLIMETKKYASEYVGNRLNCTNCHFEGGNTLGGPGGSISLVGVSHVYPRFSKRAGRNIGLAERINSCFERSMDGHPMPEDSPEMKAMITYLSWISEPVKNRKDFPWMGLPEIIGNYKPNAKRGEAIFKRSCASCHGENGQGSQLEQGETMLDVPPLFGEGSFNDGAGMGRLPMIAPFVYLNMPYQNTDLTEKEAMDVSQYVIEQPRPKFHATIQ